PAAVRMRLVESDSAAVGRGEGLLHSRTNYFVGDRADWHTDVANYSQVRYAGVYDGVDLVYRGTSQSEVEYDFELKPGADPGLIQFDVSGAQSVAVDEQGDLVLGLGRGQVVHRAPVVYQDAGDRGARQAVAGHYRVLGGGRVGFAVGDYDRSRALV